MIGNLAEVRDAREDGQGQVGLILDKTFAEGLGHATSERLS